MTSVDLSNLVMPEAGMTAAIVTCTIEGILEPEDLRALITAQPAGAVEEEDPGKLTKLRERHHSVARLAASGMSQRLIASISNYTESYLSILLNNPAMQELIAFYRAQAGNASQVIAENLRTVGLKALEKLADRLEVKGETAMDDHALIGVAKLGFDRSGHGPTSTTHNVTEHHVVDHAKIKALDEAARARSATRIVRVEDVRKALPAPEKGVSDEAA